jgi:hypothetical protein
MSDERDRFILQGTLDAVSKMYEALGMKPGQGGKFAPYVNGYEAAMQDVRAMLKSSDRPSVPKPNGSTPPA